VSESTDLQSAVENLTRTIEQLRNDLVRKDVYAADKLLFANQIAVVSKDVSDLDRKVDKAETQRAADRRLLLTAFVLPVILIIIQLYLAAQTGGAS
jgi:outer membrane murein-binding lipoprotein Lpp